MAKVPSFHSINETSKPADKRVYHNDDTCPPERDIPKYERLPVRGVQALQRLRKPLAILPCCEGCRHVVTDADVSALSARRINAVVDFNSGN